MRKTLHFDCLFGFAQKKAASRWIENYLSRQSPPDGYRKRSSRQLAGNSAQTKEVRLIEALPASGADSLKLVQKVSYNRPLWSRYHKEAYFYEMMAKCGLQNWRMIPTLLGAVRGWRTTSLFLSFETGRSPRLPEDFQIVFKAIQNWQALSEEVAVHTMESQHPYNPHFFYYNTDISQRSRGNYPRYVQNLMTHSLLYGKLHNLPILLENLNRLTQICRKFSTAITHLDLLRKNILIQEDAVLFFDWGCAGYAPRGFDYGSWLCTAFRDLPAEDFAVLAPRFWEDLAAILPTDDEVRKEERMLAALLFFTTSCLHYFSLPKNHFSESDTCPDWLASKADLFVRVCSPLFTKGVPLISSVLLKGARAVV